MWDELIELEAYRNMFEFLILKRNFLNLYYLWTLYPSTNHGVLYIFITYNLANKNAKYCVM